MRQDAIASFARPDALEKDLWAKKRARLDVDIWADVRKGDIDTDREKLNVYSDPSRRKRILESMHDRETLDLRHSEQSAALDEAFDVNAGSILRRP